MRFPNPCGYYRALEPAMGADFPQRIQRDSVAEFGIFPQPARSGVLWALPQRPLSMRAYGPSPLPRFFFRFRKLNCPNNGRLTASDLFSSTFASVVNDLPSFEFFGCDSKGVATAFSLRPCLMNQHRSAYGNPVRRERFLIWDADNASQSLRLDGPLSSCRGQVPGSHEDSSAVVMGGTIKDQFLREAGLLPRLLKQPID